VEMLPRLKRINFIKDLLSQKYALNEIHTYIWNDAKALKEIKVETPSYAKLTNSVAQGCDEIRSEIIPSLLCALTRNKGRDSVRMFEVGKIWREGESTYLGMVLGSKTKSVEEVYKELANIVRDMCWLLGIPAGYNLGKAANKLYLHPKNNADIVVAKDKKILGVIGILHPTISSSIDAKMNVAVAQIKLESMPFDVVGESYLKVSKFPKTTLDFTITTNATYGAIANVFDAFEHNLCIGYVLKDVYHREDGTVSYTVQFTVGSLEKTLTSDEIQSVWQNIVDFAKEHNISVDNT